jgi:soluble lytic murein transglycosylase
MWRTVCACLWAATALAVAAGAARADFYLYKDKRGVLNFTNAPSHGGYRHYMTEVPRFSALREFRDPARAKRYDPIILAAAERYKVDPALVKAVIRAESDFVPVARSPKGAQGLMQLMPATARMHRVNRVYDPEENVEAGTRHLRLLLDRYGGNVRLALAAYNAGSGAVDKNGGIPPYPETWEYLNRVLQFREHYSRQGG